jgi:hypothetical protein
MVDALCRVLNQAINLEDLTIIYVQLDIGNNSEFNDCLRYHQKLKVFKILYCQFPEFLRDEDYLNGIILTLSKIPTLQKVLFSPISDSGLGEISMEAITRLCKSLDNLVQLQIFGFSAPSGTTNLAPVTRALEEKNTIKDLRLPISFNKDSWIGIAKLIDSSNILETLILDVSFLPKQDEKVILILAEALQQNTTLSRLDIFCNDDNCFDEKTLEKFGFSLESNFSLRDVSFFCRQGACTTPLNDLYTKLNSLNRGDVLHGDSIRSEWVDKLFEATEDISCLYYFLSRNPSLCSVDE